MSEKLKYSAGEELLLKILRQQRKPLTTVELAELFYQDRERPFHVRASIVSTVQGLKRKVEHNKEKFSIEVSERNGPYPAEVSLRK